MYNYENKKIPHLTAAILKILSVLAVVVVVVVALIFLCCQEKSSRSQPVVKEK